MDELTLARYRQIVASMTPAQLAALRVSIMAERRLRNQYASRPGEQSLDPAYTWAAAQVPDVP